MSIASLAESVGSVRVVVKEAADDFEMGNFTHYTINHLRDSPAAVRDTPSPTFAESSFTPIPRPTHQFRKRLRKLLQASATPPPPVPKLDLGSIIGVTQEITTCISDPSPVTSYANYLHVLKDRPTAQLMSDAPKHGPRYPSIRSNDHAQGIPGLAITCDAGDTSTFSEGDYEHMLTAYSDEMDAGYHRSRKVNLKVETSVPLSANLSTQSAASSAASSIYSEYDSSALSPFTDSPPMSPSSRHSTSSFSSIRSDRSQLPPLSPPPACPLPTIPPPLSSRFSAPVSNRQRQVSMSSSIRSLPPTILEEQPQTLRDLRAMSNAKRARRKVVLVGPSSDHSSATRSQPVYQVVPPGMI